MDESDTKAVASRAREAVATSRGRAAARKDVRALVVLAILAGALYLWFRSNERVTADPASVNCEQTDSRCMAAKVASKIQIPCSDAITSQAPPGAAWDHLLDARLTYTSVYDPSTGSLIFNGNSLEHPAKGQTPARRLSYFCVVDRWGAVLKADIND